MLDDVTINCANLRVDGGMVSNNWVMQFLSDMLGVKVDRPRVLETTALGVAYLAGLPVAGWYESLRAVSELWHCERTFTPEMAESSVSASMPVGWKPSNG